MKQSRDCFTVISAFEFRTVSIVYYEQIEGNYAISHTYGVVLRRLLYFRQGPFFHDQNQ